MSSTRSQALLYRLVPTLVLAGLVGFTVFGANGLVRALQLERQATDTRDVWASLERENDRLLLELRQLDGDPVHLERRAADELGLARPGAVLYAFDDEGQAHVHAP